MNQDQMLSLVVFSLPVLALTGILLALLFFFSLRRQSREVLRIATENSELLGRLLRLTAGLEHYSLADFNKRMNEVETRKPVTVPEPSSPAFVGASRRGQVLRLHRSGESAVAIAETLGVSQGEVNLTLKLRDLFSQNVP